MKHKHAELMAQYAQDAAETNKPWERWEYYSKVRSCWCSIESHPRWDETVEYRRKPRTININGFEVPEPVRGPLERGTVYFIPTIADAFGDSKLHAISTWDGGRIDNLWLSRGLIHLTKEAATTHAKALLSFTSNE